MTITGDGNICTVCQSKMGDNDNRLFYQAPVCEECWKDLDIDDIRKGPSGDWLESVIDESGSSVLEGFMAISAQYPRDYGWNILAVINTIGETVENPQQRSMLEQSALLAGSAVLRNGSQDDPEPDPRLLSLFLVLGQFLVLSIMKRIVKDSDLRTGNILDEVRLIGWFNRKVFDMLLELDPGGDEKLEKVLAQSLSRVV